MTEVIMDVEIVQFPATNLAVIEHHGSPLLEHETVNKLIKWRQENNLFDNEKYQCYGIHYTNPAITPLEQHHVDFAISIDKPIAKNAYGIVSKTIPALRCAKARDIGSRNNNQAIIYLLEQWLPQSREKIGSYPPIFHYVNVGLTIPTSEMITDVYLPLA
ncbi:GyrI-like domain-containing protein [Gilliamella sp. B3464]|uniref:AraC family transcriptional regulator n=1 Tax=unclassified Gilliamella TaxID=2685620 RepID=UPI002269EA56|nr:MULTISPECIES: GyrI-like domain-containing protein [unclassified Gilliamella]MCX8711202.1 GyrI-like domain-containing protein [Gilliamella sp. B3468]MCX8750252.1 GyrI-like domain-containing protein [Gilliamella sp. B3464]